jgi:propanediol dehydratase small subunit
MSTGEDWLLRPVLAGCCHYESLVDGTLTLEDVAVINEALDVQAENERRYLDAKRLESGRGC